MLRRPWHIRLRCTSYGTREPTVKQKRRAKIQKDKRETDRTILIIKKVASIIKYLIGSYLGIQKES
jgi:hypothetical protein